MIHKREETKHTWVIDDTDFEIATITVDDGELFVKVTDTTPAIESAKEFHQALGEAIKIAESK